MSPAAASGTVAASSPTNSSGSSSSSSRWCPTPEQVMILEELYRSGVRTPNASHIQRITAHLSMYGKIEGKNVFYWFQNHKARDRQKLRRKLIKQLHQHQPQHLPSYDHLQNQSSSINNNSFLLNYFGYAPTPPHPPPHRPLHQEGRFGASSSSFSSSQVIVERVEANINGYDDDKQQPTIKTLQLFPVKSANLKED